MADMKFDLEMHLYGFEHISRDMQQEQEIAPID